MVEMRLLILDPAFYFILFCIMYADGLFLVCIKRIGQRVGVGLCVVCADMFNSHEFNQTHLLFWEYLSTLFSSICIIGTAVCCYCALAHGPEDTFIKFILGFVRLAIVQCGVITLILFKKTSPQTMNNSM